MFAKPLRGIHVFWIVFVFFAVVVGVDSFFIVRAIGSFPGEEVKNSYVLGLDYNREVERREKQANLGWSARAGLQEVDSRLLVVSIADRASEPVSGLSVSATYHVKGQGNDEREVTLSETSPGRYEARIDAPDKSRIEVAFAARRDASAAPVFEATKSLVIS